MSMQGFFPAHPVNEKSLYHVHFEFTGADGADPATSSFQGPLIYSIVRAAEGVYTVTLVCNDVMSEVIGAFASVNNTTNGDTTPNTAQVFVDETASTGTTVKVVCYANGTKDDLDGKRIWVHLIFRAGTSATSYT